MKNFIKGAIATIAGIAIVYLGMFVLLLCVNLLFKNLPNWIAITLTILFGFGLMYKILRFSIINIPLFIINVGSKAPSYLIIVYSCIASIISVLFFEESYAGNMPVWLFVALMVVQCGMSVGASSIVEKIIKIRIDFMKEIHEEFAKQKTDIT